jgi:putative CocE/NonD family hydrolase
MSSGSGEVRFDDGLRVPAADGTALVTDVFRPRGEGSFPALLLRTPYDRRVAQTVGFAHPAWYASQGFAVAVQDVRGRGESGGQFDLFAAEAEDGVASAAWLADQPWCNGRVGTYGYSYCGAIQAATAAASAGLIEAMAAGFYSADIRSDWAYPGGPLALAFVLSWSLDLRTGTARARREHDLLSRLERAAGEIQRLYRTLPLSELTDRLDLGVTPWAEWLGRGPEGAFWDRYSHLEVASEPPTLHFGGWYDVFAKGTIDGFRRSRGPRRLLMGPWLHGPWHWCERAPGRLVDEELVAWFQHFLGAAEAPGGPPVRAYALGTEEWLEFDDWPPSGFEEMVLHLRSDGRANTLDGDGRLTLSPAAATEPGDTFVYDPARPELAAGGHSCCDPAAVPAGPAWQNGAESSPGVLVYTSEPLAAPALLAGPVRVELSARSSAAETQLVATLCRVDREGRSTNLLEGAIRVHEHGEAGPLTLELGEVCAGLRSGERLRLDVTSSRFPQWERSMNRADLCSADAALEDAIVARTELLHNEGAPSMLILCLNWTDDRPGLS